MLWFVQSLPPNDWSDPNVAGLVGSLIVFTLSIVLWKGMFVVQPNQTEVLILFGRYLGSIKPGDAATSPEAG